MRSLCYHNFHMKLLFLVLNLFIMKGQKHFNQKYSHFQFQQIRAAIWKGEINVQSLSNLDPGSKKSFFRVSKLNNSICSFKILIYSVYTQFKYLVYDNKDQHASNIRKLGFLFWTLSQICYWRIKQPSRWRWDSKICILIKWKIYKDDKKEEYWTPLKVLEKRMEKAHKNAPEIIYITRRQQRPRHEFEILIYFILAIS